jgi:hypothetical protein
MKIVINADKMPEEDIDRIAETLAMMGVNKVSYEVSEFSIKEGKRSYKKETQTPDVVLTPSPAQVASFLEDLQTILTKHTA